MTISVSCPLEPSDVALLDPVVDEGARGSADGLSVMVGEPIAVDSRGIVSMPLASVVAIGGSPERDVVAVYLGISGDVDGHLVLVFSEAMAFRLSDMLIGLPEGTTVALDELARSALGELGNVTGTSFLNAVGNATGLVLHPSPPIVLADMCGAILDGVVADQAQVSDEALLIQVELTRSGDPGNRVEGELLVLPTPHSLRRIIDRLRQVA